MIEELGTTRWFGDSWGAPVCHPASQVPIPLGVKCSRCNIEFKEGDQGISIPFMGSAEKDSQHLACFMHTLGIGIEREQVNE